MGTRNITHSDNPAGRLHSVFQRFRAQSAGVSLDQAWAASLNFDPNNANDSSLFLSELAATVQQCVIHAKALQHVVDVSDLLVAHGEWAQAVVGFNMDRRAACVPAQVISGSAIALLGTLSGLLHSQCPELKWANAADMDKIAEVHGKLAEVADNISLDPEIPESTKAYLLQKVYSALDSIVLIELRGPQRLLSDIVQVHTGLDAVNHAPESDSQPWTVRTREAFDTIEFCAKSVLSMIAPVGAVATLLATGNFSLALFILAANPNGHPALETIGKLFGRAELELGEPKN